LSTTDTTTENGKPTTRPVGRAEFPKHTLEDSLKVPNALQQNGGQPLPAIEMATALGKSPGSGRLRVQTAASGMYGLTGGSYRTQFTMGQLGRAILEPTSPEERTASLVEAALKPRLFRDIYEYYKGKKFPQAEFFKNTVIREFNVAAEQAEKCVEVFTENMRFVGLIKHTPGGEWLAQSAGQASPAAVAAPQVDGPQIEDVPEPDTPGEPGAPSDQAPPVPPAPARKPRPAQMFLGHGGNKKPLAQLTKTLDNLGIPYGVAEDEPNMNRPISRKVRDTMEQCGSAVLIFSADHEFFDKDGNPVWKASENVANELGAAAVMYDDRVIIFKEEGVDLASNYSGIGYIEFEKDKLDAKVNELLRELVALKILKMSVGDD